ncbi:NAD(P)H-hydrate epimerase [Lacipirellula limnantheis]|uniref:NAD(P)H-hydrate epimerase n=1 Tax=Lacipirellula limnantheis TaxID=2528024 RepID=A0A517U3S9_9BACT|nr:NAD(P)H-hydrate epimerase [Lacipirellula limnantheis]QDT75279.1 Bifunctional NAD(P)H-hydrate repair enzyme Nnr [Lacipirellula limnantheis]
MAPPVLTRHQVRCVDALAIERYGMTGLVLMENAGRGAVDALLAFDPSLLDENSSPLAGPPRGPGGGAERLATANPEGVALRLAESRQRHAASQVVILCGKGNNAGDGFVMARHLEIRGVATRVLLLASPDELTGDAKANFAILQHTDVPIVDVSRGPLESPLNQHAAGAAWLVDALLGTGAAGEPREPFATAIRWMNAQPARRLAVDLPSGLDCDTGQPSPATVQSDLTTTFVAAKPGFLLPQAKPYVGELRVIDIGVPPRLVREAAAV